MYDSTPLDELDKGVDRGIPLDRHPDRGKGVYRRDS